MKMINKKVENNEMDENWLNYVENVFFYIDVCIFKIFFENGIENGGQNQCTKKLLY